MVKISYTRWNFHCA